MERLTGGTEGGDVINGLGGRDNHPRTRWRRHPDRRHRAPTRVYGGLGNDNMNGGSGDDRLIGEDENDQGLGGFGHDTLGESSDDNLEGNEAPDVLNMAATLT